MSDNKTLSIVMSPSKQYELKRAIENINLSYHNYYYHEKENIITTPIMNCSDESSHKDEIDMLVSLGLSFRSICRILRHKYGNGCEKND